MTTHTAGKRRGGGRRETYHHHHHHRLVHRGRWWIAGVSTATSCLLPETMGQHFAAACIRRRRYCFSVERTIAVAIRFFVHVYKLQRIPKKKYTSFGDNKVDIDRKKYVFMNRYF